jgi:hypothetical protein
MPPRILLCIMGANTTWEFGVAELPSGAFRSPHMINLTCCCFKSSVVSLDDTTLVLLSELYTISGYDRYRYRKKSL